MFSKLIYSAVLLFALSSCNKTSTDKTVAATSTDSTANMKSENSVLMGGKTVHTVGKLPATGTEAPAFTLADVEMGDKTLDDFKGKSIILNIFPSVDTGVCSASVRKFNKEAANLPNAVVLCISKDLPLAQKRFCGAEGIKNVVMLSDYRSDFGKTYGVQLTDSPMRGLLSRAVVVINPEGKIVYEEQVSDISHEPNYEAAIKAVKG
ncbi:thiol peroxidase (atypical 2-Cys peroxiredoxin) [Halpernia frigidisoli]|uniref:Thiol peroxidase n=2 Tax=Halpernia frigidisoli TaxID=1125876 RepID=A0A1I3D8Q3_9FLAO|nr:thiol peroxidase (atypical 2-Cys peroxiredoxin) [Halpernia frigidisoli]